MASVRTNASTIHRSLKFNMDKNLWQLEKNDKLLANIGELITYYKENNIKGVKNEEPCRLLNPIERPMWILNRNMLSKSSKILGSGNFCEVSVGKYLDRKVAIKTCHETVQMGETTVVFEDVEAPDPTKSAKIEVSSIGILDAQFALVEEAQLMFNLTHKNIILFVGLCCENPPVQLVIELCKGGSLLSHLEEMQKNKMEISKNELVNYVVQIVDGMQYLQSRNMTHRDLAVRNMLLGLHGELNISDFGLAKMAARIYNEDISHSQIPLRGMAPECLVKNAAFSLKIDVWSFGMVMYEIFNHGGPPRLWYKWPLKKIATYIRRVQMPPAPKSMPKEIDELMQRFWQKEPQNRPDFNDLAKLLEPIVKTIPPLVV